MSNEINPTQVTPKTPPKPLEPFDRAFILAISAISSIIIHKSLPRGLIRKVLTVGTFGVGAGYAFGMDYKCCRKSIKTLFNGFRGCSLDPRRWNWSWDTSGSNWPTSGNDGGSSGGHSFKTNDLTRETEKSPPPASHHGTGKEGTFEVMDE